MAGNLPPQWAIPLGFLGLCLVASWALFRATGTRSHDEEGGELPGPVLVQAIGRDGWVVAERRLDHDLPALVEEAAADLRAAVRGETGWQPRVVVLDDQGRDVTDRYGVSWS